jgi:hypothetical protein
LVAGVRGVGGLFAGDGGVFRACHCMQRARKRL